MKNNMDKVLIGTSGWSYDEWVGPFYPKSLKNKEYLLYYSKIFNSSEINTTFYNIPSRRVVEGWVKRTPSDFLFSAKIPKSITHDNKLDINNCLEELELFLETMKPLIDSKKLLAFLIQLPPSFRKAEHFNNLKEFIANWPRDRESGGYNLVIEFRHKSWMDDDTFTYLKKNKLSYCTVIEPLLPPRMDITNKDLAYVRFHGYGKKIWFDYFFNEEEIEKWAISVKNVIANSKKIGIYFNNHFSGYAAKNCLMMMSELDIKPRNDPSSIQIFEIKKKSGAYSRDQTSLDKFV
ncbi:MAG: DUF72 domain-containing protein [Promethearchaeota archaeon]|nr:MAG: DUF72 domain-containing protein [Candidatus Lokiarchaeota archaeon]